MAVIARFYARFYNCQQNHFQREDFFYLLSSGYTMFGGGARCDMGTVGGVKCSSLDGVGEV